MAKTISLIIQLLRSTAFTAVAVVAIALALPAAAQMQGDGQHRRPQPDAAPQPGTGNKPKAAPPAGKPTEPRSARQLPPKRETPLQRLLKDGIPDNSIKRARLRDSLYALLATSSDEKSAGQVANAISQLWLTSGSDTVDLLMRRAIKALGAKQSELSMRLLNAVIALAPDYAEAWNRRAYIHYKNNDPRAAAGDLRRVLALDPRHYKALEGLGTILRESGDDVNALKVFERLMDIHPNAKGARQVYDDLKRKVEGRGI